MIWDRGNDPSYYFAELQCLMRMTDEFVWGPVWKQGLAQFGNLFVKLLSAQCVAYSSEIGFPIDSTGTPPQGGIVLCHSTQRVEDCRDESNRFTRSRADYNGKLEYLGTSSIFHNQEMGHLVAMLLRPTFFFPTVSSRPVLVYKEFMRCIQLMFCENSRQRMNPFILRMLKDPVWPDCEHGIQDQPEVESLPWCFKDHISATHHTAHVTPWLSCLL